jgi:hypothetical protein
MMLAIVLSFVALCCNTFLLFLVSSEFFFFYHEIVLNCIKGFFCVY